MKALASLMGGGQKTQTEAPKAAQPVNDQPQAKPSAVVVDAADAAGQDGRVRVGSGSDTLRKRAGVPGLGL